MRDLKSHNDADEGLAMDLIFDACRANDMREDWVDPSGHYVVTFYPLTSAGSHCAYLSHRLDGELIASAIVDEDDV